MEKAGTTFWRRFLQVMDSGIIANPYSIEPDEKIIKSQQLLLSHFYRTTSEFKSNTVFMFSRDPYSRLLSGYLDKIYSANPTYWKILGGSIRSNKRTNCYHNVTFLEYVEYAIRMEKIQTENKDPHPAAMYDLCKPCIIDYDFIGKMETFKADVSFLLNNYNLSEYWNTFTNFANETFEDNIWDISHSFLDWKSDIEKCMPIHEAYLRTWRRLQLRGQIMDGMKFPASEREAETLTRRDFVKLVRSAHEISKGKVNLKEQKKNLFERIYASLPREILEELPRVFTYDFEIFDYEARPSSLFNTSTSLSSDNMDLFRFQHLK